MNGILVVDKPAGFTSFDVVAKLRGICQTKKIGHGGTLDPMATGVLPVFVGGAVKAVDLAPRQDKIYEAVVRFGVATDTGDVTGEVLRRSDVRVAQAELEAVLPRFLGTQSQTPPMYSAVKVDGKPLYKYAREGKTVQRKPREITVHSLEFLGEGDGENEYRLRVHCAKGTYIRTLLEDMGAVLEVPATLAGLRRTAAGMFSLEEAHTLDEIQAARDEGRLEELFRPVERVFEGLPRLEIDEAALARLLNGAPARAPQPVPGRYRAVCGGRFAGLVNVNTEGEIRAEKLFREELARQVTGLG